jgi:hypothetical protein
MYDIFAGTPELLADWIEASVVLSQFGTLGIDEILRLGKGDVGAEDGAINSALTIIAKRQQILGLHYPFEIRQQLAVTFKESSLQNIYLCLSQLTPESLARQTVRSNSSTIPEMSVLLEEVAEVALANLWGVGGRAIRFGYPSRHGRPPDFDQAIRWLADEMGVTVGQGYRDPRRQDGGVDVVAWRNFADHRPGFPIALAQCTIQKEAFTKTTDIDLRLWSSWLALDVDPLNILVLPGTIRGAGPDWGQLSTVVMVIERIRLMELLSRGSIPERLVTAWTESILSELRTIVGSAQQ